MSDFTCTCGDFMLATCTTGPDAAAYIALVVVALSVAAIRMCTCDWGGDDDDSSDEESTDSTRSMFS
jgi:hypothetical protein